MNWLKYFTVPSITSILASIIIAILLNWAGVDWQVNLVTTLMCNLLVILWTNVSYLKNKQEDISSIKNKIDKSDVFLRKLLLKRSEIDNIYSHLNQKSGMLKDLGIKTFNDYINNFEIRKEGIFVKGEEMALEVVKKFWTDLNQIQKDDESTCRVVRIVHSNDISVWNPDNNPIANELYIQQRAFINNGGYIYRILIGHLKEPDENYNKVMETMIAHDIVVRYVCKSYVSSYKYDFLHYDLDNFVVGWQSENTNNPEISGFILSDGFSLCEIFTRWETLFNYLEMENRSLNIPAEQQKRMDELFKQVSLEC